MNPSRATFGATLSVLATLLLAACESRPDRHAMMEEARRAVPPMAANGSFFDGTVVAHLTLGSDPNAFGGPGGEGDRGGPRGGGGGRHHGGGMGGGGMPPPGGPGGPPPGGMEGAPSPAMRASTLPPAILRLRLENTTAAAINVEVRGVDSELGDFAVRPDKFTVPAGQSAEPDPMESLLGVENYSLPVTITLRSAGRTETKVLTLQLVPPPAAP